MILVDVGVPARLHLRLADGATDKYPRAIVRDSLNAVVATVDLAHSSNGRYTGTFTPATLGYYTADFIVYEDAPRSIEDVGYEQVTDQYRAITFPSAEAIADAVWDEPALDHDIAGTFGHLINHMSLVTAGNVWDELVALHSIPNTFGDWVQAIHQWSKDSAELLADANIGLFQLKNEIINQGQLTRVQVDANEVKIDQIIPAVNLARDNVNANVDVNEVKIEQIISDLPAVQAAIITEVNQNETKLDALSNKIGTIQNNTTTRFVVLEKLIKPEVGTKDYEFHLRLYDTEGNPEAPDVTPTITITRIDTGGIVVSNAAMSQIGVEVGAYKYVHTISSGTALAPLLVEAKVTEGGIARLVPAVTEIVEFESDLDAIQTQLTSMDTKVTDTQSKVNNPVFGLSALQAGQLDIVSEIDDNEAKIDAIKAKTDLLPADPASQTDVLNVNATVLTRPTLAQIQTALNNIRDSIKGLDNRDLTEVYDNQPDLSTVAKTADPRFAYLDAAISSRSTLTASQVWTHVTRTLTDTTLDVADAAVIWDYLTSAATTPGSIGKRIADFLDAAVSSRATSAQVSAALAGVAQETTVSGLYGHVTTETNQIETVVNAVQLVVNAIKAKTDNLPSSPASTSTVTSESAAIQALITALNALVVAVKAKTDTLPGVPLATSSQVAAIPTNPLLDNDARLGRLDVNISTRATPADLLPLATSAALAAAKTSIESKIDAIDAELDGLATSAELSAAVAPLATTFDVNAAAASVITALPPPPPTPSDIWSFPTRTLTSPTNIATTSDLAPLAKTSDIASIPQIHQYMNRMSCMFNTAGNFHELIAWAEKDGQRVLAATNCTVSVKDSTGVTVWTQSLPTPNADGIFRFQNAIVADPDANYYVVIQITVDAAVRISHGSYITVG